MKKTLSVNRYAWNLTQQLMEDSHRYGVEVVKADKGTTLIDAGIKAKGGYEAGRLITEICMGGCGRARITQRAYDELELPSIFVHSDHPLIATLGSQFAGWQIKEKGYFAIGSGPARALALKPKKIYDKINYRDQSDKAIVVLETAKHPPSRILNRIADECSVSPECLVAILTPTTSIAGATQVSGRIVETGIHKLKMLGFDVNTISHAWGSAPIPPAHPKFERAMARANDAILYGGMAYYTVDCDDQELKNVISKAPSKASDVYGKPFWEIFREAEGDFYKIDPHIFAPAVLIANNARTGRTHTAGQVNSQVLAKSFGL